jgi:hypothetical protein
MLHTENQLLRLSRTALIVMKPGVVVVVCLQIIILPQQRLFYVVLGCWLGCGNNVSNRMSYYYYYVIYVSIYSVKTVHIIRAISLICLYCTKYKYFNIYFVTLR